METYASREFKFDSESGEISGYGAVFNNIDHGQDKILPGAFSKSLLEKNSLPMLFSHDVAKPVGAWSELSEDDRGLKVAGRISDTSLGRDVRTLAKDQALTGLSIGYRTVNADYEKDGVRLLKELDLIELSLVVLPMNELARISAVKSRLAGGRTVARDDLEFLLRNAGFSRRGVKRLLADGYSGLSQTSQTVDALARLADTLEHF